jgi:hypothetical protein
MKRAMYAGLGLVTWRLAKRYMRRRARGFRHALPI